MQAAAMVNLYSNALATYAVDAHTVNIAYIFWDEPIFFAFISPIFVSGNSFPNLFSYIIVTRHEKTVLMCTNTKFVRL